MAEKPENPQAACVAEQGKNFGDGPKILPVFKLAVKKILSEILMMKMRQTHNPLVPFGKKIRPKGNKNLRNIAMIPH
ncbi:hypothetical protein [uncultured Treponema sp.]|uniref:hypothetical protein n=1 Tax=uncultured Treponema sp. TaxID=162155 RepID=UPI0025CF9173|nr:hypothetical protein [uncultured Treponema sp.]